MNVEANPSLMVGVFGLGLVQITHLYMNTAPSLQELRSSPPGDDTARQQLLDANILVGTITAIVAIMAATVTKSPWPIVMFMGGLGLVAVWHHLVLDGEII